LNNFSFDNLLSQSTHLEIIEITGKKKSRDRNLAKNNLIEFLTIIKTLNLNNLEYIHKNIGSLMSPVSFTFIKNIILSAAMTIKDFQINRTIKDMEFRLQLIQFSLNDDITFRVLINDLGENLKFVIFFE
jgi:hypothetical protein